MRARTSSSGGALRDFFRPGRIVVLVVVAITLIFVFENTRQTRVRLLIPEATVPLWTALFATLVIGAVCGYYLNSRDRRY